MMLFYPMYDLPDLKYILIYFILNKERKSKSFPVFSPLLASRRWKVLLLHWYVLTCQDTEKILFHFETSTHFKTILENSPQ